MAQKTIAQFLQHPNYFINNREALISKVLIYSAQEQSIQTNYIKCNIDKSGKSCLFRICGRRNETMSYSERMWQTSPKGVKTEA